MRGHAAGFQARRLPGGAVHVGTPLACRALPAGRVVVRGYPAPHRESLILALDDHARDFVPDDVRRLAVQVPGHQLAAAQATGLGAHQNPARRTRHIRGFFNAKPPPGVVAGQLHGRKTYFRPLLASRSRKTCSPSSRARSPLTSGVRSNSGSSSQLRAVRTALVPKWNGEISEISS